MRVLQRMQEIILTSGNFPQLCGSFRISISEKKKSVNRECFPLSGKVWEELAEKNRIYGPDHTFIGAV